VRDFSTVKVASRIIPATLSHGYPHVKKIVASRPFYQSFIKAADASLPLQGRRRGGGRGDSVKLTVPSGLNAPSPLAGEGRGEGEDAKQPCNGHPAKPGKLASVVS